ncbi:MAG: hypothetical protein ABIH89_08775 [Elusimicrobiota bacterium]
MKRIFSLLLALYYISLLACDGIARIDPYSYYPTKVFRPDGQLFKPAKQIIDTNPLRPLVITDKNGNKTYVTSKGDVMVSVDKDGNKAFSIHGRKSHERNMQGQIDKKWKRQAGSNMIEVTNEYDEKVGYMEQGLGGKTVAEYDEDLNITKTFEYDKYGKNVQWVVDELTQAKVKYDEQGKAGYDLDYEGNKIATYRYDLKGILVTRTDAYGNVTSFDKKGNRIQTVTEDGELLATYTYKKDENGYYQIESVKDKQGNVTLYTDGKQQKEIDENGTVTKLYKWQGSKLIFSEDVITGQVTWYDNGKPVYTTYEGELVNEWFYHEGKMVGLWVEPEGKFQLYSHGMSKLDFYFNRRPEMDELLDIYKTYGIEL